MICEKCGREYADFRAVCLCGNPLIPGLSEIKEQQYDNSTESNFIVKPFNDGVEIVSYSSFTEEDSLQIPSIINGLLVKRIGKCVFMKTSFVEISIPSSVSEIGASAFLDCENLKYVALSEGLLKIEKNCFCGCKQLKNLSFPSTIQYVEEDIIKKTAIKELTITKNIKIVPSFFCARNTTIKKVIFEEGVEEIDAYAFYNTAVNNIIIPKSVKTIRGGAFGNVAIAILGTDTKLEWCRDTPPIGEKSKIYCQDGSEALAFCRKNDFNALPLDDYGKKDEKVKAKTSNKQPVKTEKSVKIIPVQLETIIPYTDVDSSRSRILLVDKKYKKYDSKTPEKEKYKYLCAISNLNNGTSYKLCGIENSKVYVIFDRENVVFSVSAFNKFEEHIEKVSDNYMNTRNNYIEKIIDMGKQLQNTEAGLIAKNLAQTIPLDLMLDPESISQFDYHLTGMIGNIDHHINDAFFLSSELYRNTYISKLKSKTMKKEIKKYQAAHKKYYYWRYNEFFDNVHINFDINDNIKSIYSNSFSKFLDYICQYYDSEIESISKQFSKKEFPANFKEKKIISIYLSYNIFKIAIYNVATNEYGKIISENSGLTISKYANILRDKFDSGFINVRNFGLFVLALTQNNIFNSDNYIENYKKFESEYNILEQKSDVEKFREKFALSGAAKIYTLKDIDLMTGIEFENFLCDLFQKMGYHTLSTKISGDQGIDIVAEKDSIKIGIQAKCYTGTVGNAAIQEAVAGKTFYSCDKVMVITNSRFTKSAIELAKANNVILWDRDMLKENL